MRIRPTKREATKAPDLPPRPPEPPPRPRNKVPTAKYIAYELPGAPGIEPPAAPHTNTCRPAPSSRRHGESEDDWLARTRERFVPADAVNVRILSD
jgi:hypothetical protein